MYRPGFPPPYGAFGAPPQSYMPPGAHGASCLALQGGLQSMAGQEHALSICPNAGAPPPYGYGGPTGFPGAAPQPARRPGA